MIKTIFKKIKEIIKKENKIEAKIEQQNCQKTNTNSKNSLNLPDKNDLNSQINWLIKNKWIDVYDPNKKTLLIMDDREAIISSILDDLYSLEELNYDFSISNYNILKVHSKMAGFYVLEILENAPLIKIDYAILDIILGGKKVINDKRVMIDGVDVAIEIWKKFNDAKILFFSGCIIETNSRDIFNFKDKFEEFTDEPIENYLLTKDINFDDELEKLSYFFSY